MMECRDLTNDVLTGPVPAAARAHLERCASCRGRREQLRSLERRLTALGRALSPQADPALARRIIARIPKQAAPRTAAWKWAAGIAAAAALLAALLLATRETPAPAAPRE